MDSQVPDNLCFLVVGNDLTDVLFQNRFLCDKYENIPQIFIKAEGEKISEKVGGKIAEISKDNKQVLVFTTKEVIKEMSKESGASIKDWNSPVLMFSSVSDMSCWAEDLEEMRIEIYLGKRKPTFEVDIFEKYRKFVNDQMREAQGDIYWMEHSIQKQNTQEIGEETKRLS